MSVAARKSQGSIGRRRRLEWLAGQVDPANSSGRLPALLIVILTGILLWAFLLTNDFQIDSVRVQGAELSDVDEVVEMSQALNRSSFRARPDEIAARVETLPAVESASVELRYPGQVTIVVTEREPVLAVTNGLEHALISDDGTVISPRQLAGLPQLSVHGFDALTDADLSTELVAAVRAVFSLYGNESRLTLTRDIGLSLELTGGRSVLLGSPELMDTKLTVLSAVELQVDSNWSQLDLREPSRPAYR